MCKNEMSLIDVKFAKSVKLNLNAITNDSFKSIQWRVVPILI